MFQVRSLRRWTMTVLTALLFAFSTGAMAQRADGAVAGNATPGDQVNIVNLDTGLKRETKVNDDGRYRFGSVPLGKYQVTITRGEERVLSAVVTLRPGTTARPPTPAAPSTAAGEAPQPAAETPASN